MKSNPGRPDRRREGYGGPPTLHATAEGLRYVNTGSPEGLRYVNAGSPEGLRYVNASRPEVERYVDAGSPEGLRYVDAGRPDGLRDARAAIASVQRSADASSAQAPHRVEPDRPERLRFERATMADMLARATVVTLFTLLSVNLFTDFVRTGHVTGLLLLAGESLVVVLTIVRRRARLVDRSFAAAVMTTLSVAGPPLLRATDGVPMAPDVVTAMISAVGLVLVVVGKIALGRSFGVVPANRGVVVRGPYTWVRHPIYTGYLITHVAFFMANPHPWNAWIIVVADIALIVRALMEERVLSADAEYQGYCRRVGWHLVPGVF